MSEFAGKVALVTGGASGIGQAACLEFARAGATVAVVDMNAEAGAATVAAVRDLGCAAQFFAADVSQSADVQAYVKRTLDAFGRIDAFFNNAGIEGVVAPLTEYPEEMFDRVIAINVRGVFLGLKYVLPIMIKQQSGCVVNTASVAGLVGAPHLGAYSTSKHAIIGLTRTAAGEVGRSGVRVNAICPGPISTRMMRSIEQMSNPADPDAVMNRNVARNPMGRYGDPAEIARVVVFLCSGASGYVNGAAWTIDGGRTSI
ncbi:MAG: glucose 1-dehydrogenase [Anaerolineae bacterium]|nr:glucose 1-dehydrogenase [Anaerolineae bacterium]